MAPARSAVSTRCRRNRCRASNCRDKAGASHVLQDRQPCISRSHRNGIDVHQQLGLVQSVRKSCRVWTGNKVTIIIFITVLPHATVHSMFRFVPLLFRRRLALQPDTSTHVQHSSIAATFSLSAILYTVSHAFSLKKKKCSRC